MLRESILATVGNTPLVRLNRIFPEAQFTLYAKLESFNPGGSMKDRPAAHIIKCGLEAGVITKDTVIIESSSGNMGIGLAQTCAYYGLRLICVVDPKATRQNIRLLRAYGAEVDLVEEPDPETGEFLQARLNRVRHLALHTENSFWPDQYSNPNNPGAHRQTMHEIATALGGQVDYLFCSTSTCGTMRGCAEYVREHGLLTKIMAVDALGSVIFGDQEKKQQRLIPGHGAAVRPALFEAHLADEPIHVSDLDCVIGCRRLAKYEAILAGGSSGAVIMALEQVRHRLRPGATCVAVLADRGERYLDTVYSDRWVRQHFGDVSHLWEQLVEAQCV
jgi:2,3-diaminopropionate biosynthesis protein SbnA